MENNDKIISAFMQAAANIRDNLEWITAQVDNLEGHYNPDNLTWGDVGDIRRIDNVLEECTSTIAMAFGIETEEI